MVKGWVSQDGVTVAFADPPGVTVYGRICALITDNGLEFVLPDNNGHNPFFPPGDGVAEFLFGNGGLVTVGYRMATPEERQRHARSGAPGDSTRA